MVGRTAASRYIQALRAFRRARKHHPAMVLRILYGIQKTKQTIFYHPIKKNHNNLVQLILFSSVVPPTLPQLYPNFTPTFTPILFQFYPSFTPIFIPILFQPMLGHYCVQQSYLLTVIVSEGLLFNYTDVLV